jgi:hypothetical protein
MAAAASGFNGKWLEINGKVLRAWAGKKSASGAERFEGEGFGGCFEAAFECVVNVRL